jgi:hypothetical protein
MKETLERFSFLGVQITVGSINTRIVRFQKGSLLEKLEKL